MRGSAPPRHFAPRAPRRQRFALRRLIAAVVALVVVGALGGAAYLVARPGSSNHAATLKAGRSQSTKATVPATTTTLPPPPAEPGGGYTLFPSHRVVAFYGAPSSPTLGVLGDAPPDQLWPRLAAAAAPFASAQTVLVPSYELIAFVAQAHPGPGSTYSYELPVAQINSYLQVVQAHGGMLILDIQPGRGNLLADAQALEPWLVQPDVGLALDPEWELQPGQFPDVQIGHTTAAEINQVSTWLEQLTVAHRLPQKLLVIHQFRISMIQNKPDVTPQPNLAIAFNMDGFGGANNKVSVYQLLATDPRWPLGYKLFYTRDKPLQTPAEVLALTPAPQVVEYE